MIRCARFLVLPLLLLTGCGLDPAGTRFFELVETSPADGQTGVVPFGRYYAVFNTAVAYTEGDDVAMSFPGRVTANAETLFFERSDPLPPFGRSDWFSIRTLTPAGGGRERFDRTVNFTVAPGEQEDNNTPDAADTLPVGGVLTGITGKEGAPLDRDFFVAPPDSPSAVILVVERLGSTPLFLVTLPHNRVHPLDAVTRVRFETGDTVDFVPSAPRRFYLTNEAQVSGRLVRYAPDGWYRIRSLRP